MFRWSWLHHQIPKLVWGVASSVSWPLKTHELAILVMTHGLADLVGSHDLAVLVRSHVLVRSVSSRIISRSLSLRVMSNRSAWSPCADLVAFSGRMRMLRDSTSSLEDLKCMVGENWAMPEYISKVMETNENPRKGVAIMSLHFNHFIADLYSLSFTCFMNLLAQTDCSISKETP